MMRFLLAAAALVLLESAAYAGNAHTGSGAGATSTSVANSTSGSRSSATTTVNITEVNSSVGTTGGITGTGGTGTTGSGGAGPSGTGTSGTRGTGSIGSGGAGTTGSRRTTAYEPATGSSSSTTSDSEQYIGYGGGYTVHNTPDVIPPNVAGGNACAVGASGGIAVAGLGLAGGATWADRACERRQQAALMYNMGEPKVAFELMCQDDNVRAAMKAAGKPCSVDVVTPAANATSAPVAAMPMQPAAMPAIVIAAAPAPANAAAPTHTGAVRPAWCAQAKSDDEQSRSYIAKVCGPT